MALIRPIPASGALTMTPYKHTSNQATATYTASDNQEAIIYVRANSIYAGDVTTTIAGQQVSTLSAANTDYITSTSVNLNANDTVVVTGNSNHTLVVVTNGSGSIA